MKQLRVASFFTGAGGIDVGFEQAGFKTVFANEIDAYPSEIFKANFDCPLVIDDIKNINPDDLPEFDVLLAGFPCQAFSVAGYRKGFADERGNLFFEVMRIVEACKPKIVFLENVKNLVGHDKGNTFRVILDALKQNDYYVKYQVLNTMIHGNVPQNRERIYVVAFLDESVANRFNFPDPIALETKLSDVIDFESKLDDKYYYTADKYDFYGKLAEAMTNEDTVYQWRRVYVRENKSNVCPTLTANMGTGGHNVPLVKTKTGIRKLTPHECFNLQGFPLDFKLPEKLSNGRLYKAAGNSVSVPVIKRIAQQLKQAL